ncbi:MAG: hypothetical protein V3V97_02570 [Hyphomicrobiaceae bacterium]
MVVSAYVILDLLSNRTPVQVLLSYVSFNALSAYTRILQWYFVTAEIAQSPILGIGFHEHARLSYMSSSIDNFWLVTGLRYGMVSFSMLVLAMVVLGFKLAYLKINDVRILDYRKGWIIMMVGLAVAASTVHFWNALFVYYMFLSGTGVWMLDEKSDETSDDQA